jgi:dihydrodipicolinate synthase/N-acetylneuraminate lyase
MPEYTRREAKEWARANLRGVCNVIMPTFAEDLSGLNEAAIRHDVRRNVELGFWGALIVAECGTTLDEYKRFMEIVVDEARGRMRTVLHASFDTLDGMLEAARHAEEVGVDLVLPAFPQTFYPRSTADLYRFIERFARGTDLAISLFCAHQWNFGRLHPSEFPPSLVAELANIDTVVAAKYEVGRPAIAGVLQVHKLCGDRIVVSDPGEWNAPVWVNAFGMQWMGTSGYEYFGGTVPQMFRLLHEGQWDEAMEIYWRIHPARVARLADAQSYAGANFIHRFNWKYMGWLQGYNGGSLRAPVMRVGDAALKRLRDALVRSGFELGPETEDVTSFLRGRVPDGSGVAAAEQAAAAR